MGGSVGDTPQAGCADSDSFARAIGQLSNPALTAFCLAGSGLLLQLVQTRIFSSVFWNHLVYFVVSIALLGFGISGTWLSLGATSRLARLLTLRVAASGFAVSGLASSLLVSAQQSASSSNFAILVGTYAIAVLPYFFLGWMLGTIYRDNVERINSIYFADLCGAATGCLLFLGLIQPLGAIRLVVLACFTCSAVVFLQFGARAKRMLALTLLGAGAVALMLMQARIESRMIPEATKGIVRLYENLEPGDAKVEEFSEWNAISRIQVVSTKNAPHFKRVFIDGDAYTRIAIPAAVESPHVVDMVFAARPKPKDVLVIGPGGGYDVRRAVEAGAGHTDAAEINPTTVRLMQERYNGALEGLFQRPDVNLHAEEGRSFVRRSPTQYDIITMSHIDSFAALNSGAYVLSENYLYTVDSFVDFIGHLKPGGILFVSRWSYQPEAVRLFAVVLEALDRVGVTGGAAEQCIAAYSKDNISLFISNRPISSEDFARLDAFAATIGAERVYPLAAAAPRSKTAEMFEQYAAARQSNNLEPLLVSLPYDVRIVSDDSPFFFHYERLNNLGVEFDDGSTDRVETAIRGKWPSFTLWVLLGVTSIAVAAFILLPLALRGAVRISRFPLWLLYFAALGVSFIFVEIAIMQRLALLLGHPVRSMALVLAGLLVSAGIGSRLGRNLLRTRPRLLFTCLIASILAAAFLYPFVIKELLFLPLVLRGAGALLMVFLLGFWMGIPFPSALREVSSKSADVVPWMWGVNGGCTVLGSISAIALAIQFNFTAVFVLAAFGYLTAGLCYGIARRA